jgi:hypothetical protein
MRPSSPLLRTARLAAAIVVGLAAVAVLPTPAHAATAAFTVESQWSSGYTARMTVHNNSDATLTSWRVEFDLPAGTTIDSYWSIRMTRDGNHYVFSSMPWNGTLAAGASTSFGWVARGSGTPQNCTVNGAPCSGAPRLDVTPPSTPGNARYTTGPMTTLVWEPSTDDTGVVGYQIFHRTTQVATTTGTSHSMPTPPPMVTTYGVRAVDAAGNVSPFAPIHFGQLPDSTPPTAPTSLRIGSVSPGHLTVRWDAATDDVFLVGYEIYLNGALISKVGGTSGYVPYRGYGTYVFRVRAWDSSGNFGPYAEVGLAIDPPPSPPAR